MQLLRRSLGIGTALLVAACGGGGGGSTGPNNNNNNGGYPSGSQTLGTISTSVTSLSLSAGQGSTISVTAEDTQGQRMTTFTAQFASANPAVAEVASNGSVLAIGAGTTQITVSVTVGTVTKTASVGVTVTGSLPLSASVSATADAVFAPAKVIIGVGGSVSFQFGAVTHTVTFDASGAPSSIGDSYSTSVSRSFPTAGNFTYHCNIHYGMTGEVMVR